MDAWSTYRIEDFLLFAPRAYWRLFLTLNTGLWPLQLVTVAAGLALIALLWRRPERAARPLALLLAAAWALVGWQFFGRHYPTINWAAEYVAPLFLLQALLLAGIGLAGPWRLVPGGWRGRLGSALAAGALLLYPLLAPLQGRGWRSAEVFGVAPDPTAIATLGCLLLVRGRLALLLWPLPIAWCCVTGLTLWAMAEPQAWLPPAAALLALGTAWLSRWPRHGGSGRC